MDTLQSQVSGYGTKEVVVQRTLDRMELKEPIPLETWDEAAVSRFVAAFLIERFPTVLVLNKVDSPDADKNIARICQKYPSVRAGHRWRRRAHFCAQHPMVLVSALAECFLRKLAKQGFIGYTDGGDFIETSDENAALKAMDEKTKERVEKLKDLVMLRFGGTGVHDVIRKAVERLGLIPVFLVNNITNFTCGGCAAYYLTHCRAI